ncbi:hypothetical protein Nepgr_033690 [Nepenthes gracilis]|uniref:Uncharacterized protein n=1 Tax=Nepenthes gracilis TaxID=150966 RepID=A0AAD3Y935_NEPGR|nr:hypothetical protein Nepgr_033690 [Nepenthes gracilis]
MARSTGNSSIDNCVPYPDADEDYIVFCFEEDGVFYVSEENSPRHANWKGEDESEDEEFISLSPRSQGGGRNGVNMNTPDAGSGILSKQGEGGGQIEESTFGTAESRDLDPSGGRSSSSSTSSFAFPALQWEWVGSPVPWPWPNPGRLQFKKHKSRRVCLCWRGF